MIYFCYFLSLIISKQRLKFFILSYQLFIVSEHFTPKNYWLKTINANYFALFIFALILININIYYMRQEFENSTKMDVFGSEILIRL